MTSSGNIRRLYSSGSFTEFIEATSEADIPPFSAEPLPDVVAPDAYGHPAPEAPVNAAPGILGYDEPAAATGGVPDAQESAPDAQEYDQPDVPGDSVLDAQESAPDAEQYDPPAGAGDRAPDAWEHDEPAVPSGRTPEAFGRGELSSPDRGGPGSYGRGEPEDSGPDLSSDAADTPVSGFHAMIRMPAAPAANRPVPAVERPSPPSARIEQAPRPTWTTPPAEERISPPGEWHIASRPAASASGGAGPGSTATAASAGYGSAGHGSTGHGSTGHGVGGGGTLAAPGSRTRTTGRTPRSARRSPATC